MASNSSRLKNRWGHLARSLPSTSFSSMDCSRCFNTTGRMRFLATYSWSASVSRPDTFWCIPAASILRSFHVVSSTFDLILMLCMPQACLTKPEVSRWQYVLVMQALLRFNDFYRFAVKYNEPFLSILYVLALRDAPSSTCRPPS